MKKLITISLISFIFLLVAPTAALASGKNSGEQKTSHYSTIQKSETKDWNQGKSKSDPDDNGKGPDRSNGGHDKPGYTGGINSDKDGNNGCGNDSDREDDNEGWCGNKPKTEKEDKDHNKCESKCDESKDNDHKDKEEKHDNSGCHEDKKPDPKPEPKPTPVPTPTPNVVVVAAATPSVLGATTLPNTGVVEDFALPALFIAGALLIIAGLALMLVSVVFKKTLSLKKN